MNRDNPESWEPDETPKKIYNPLDKSFTSEYRNDKNEIETVTIPALDIISLPMWLALHTGKDLVDAIINDRSLGFLTPEERAKIEAEVFI